MKNYKAHKNKKVIYIYKNKKQKLCTNISNIFSCKKI